MYLDRAEKEFDKRGGMVDETSSGAPAKPETEPPPHPAVGQRFSPDDVDWEHPALSNHV